MAPRPSTRTTWYLPNWVGWVMVGTASVDATVENASVIQSQVLLTGEGEKLAGQATLGLGCLTESQNACRTQVQPCIRRVISRKLIFREATMTGRSANAAKGKRLMFLIAMLLVLMTAGRVSAADTPLPEGTLGWWVFDWGKTVYANSPAEACELTAQNHMGTHLVDMRPRSDSLWFDCKYPNMIRAGGVQWYGVTWLICASGYKATSEGICVKTYEPAPPLSCKPGKRGFGQGNPVMVSTGAKVQREFDLIGAVSNSLKIERTYRTFKVTPKISSGGESWFFGFARTFRPTQRLTDGRPRVIDGTFGDGTYFEFTWNNTAKKYESTFDKAASLTSLDPLYEDWMLIQGGRVEHYKKRVTGASNGFVLMSSQTLDGSIQYYTYATDSLLLQEIIDDRGRKLEVTWGSHSQVASISGADGKVLYNYDFPWGGYPSWGSTSRLISVDYVDASGTLLGSKQYHYEDARSVFLLTGITDENGKRFATYAYDGNGRTVLSEHADGAYRYSFAYPDNYTRIVTDPLGAQRTVGLRKVKEMWLATGESQPGGSGCTPGSNAITHDPQGNISSQTDFNDNKVCYRYDARNLETSQVSGLLSSDTCPTSGNAALTRSTARRATTQWHSDFPLRTTVAEANRITTYVYNGQMDSAGGLAQCAPGVTLPNGKPLPLLCSMSVQATTDTNGASGLSAQRIGTARVWSYTYDANGRLLTSTGPQDANGRSATESRTYYQDDTATHRAGDLVSVTNAAGEVTQYLEYSLSGLATSIRLPNGQTVTLRYGPGQRLMSITLDDGSGSVERNDFEYDAVGNLTRATNPEGSAVTYTYDAAHRLTDVSDSAGNRKHLDLDGMGNVVQEQVYGPDGELAWKLTRSFDVLNRLQLEQRGLQQAGTTFEYDRNGNLTRLIDQLDRATTRQYDSFNRVTREQLPTPLSDSSPHVIDYTYNQQDQLLAVRDPKGFTTRYTVDGFGQRTALSSPDTGVSSSVFDGAGNLTSSTDARNVVTSNAYDAAGRVTRAGTSTYEYGAVGTAGAGLLTMMRDESGQTEFGYDGFGRLLTKTQNVTGPVTRSFNVRYAYGTSGAGTGHVTSMTYPSGNRVDIAYDSVGRPSSLALSAPGTATPISLLTDIAYRPFGAVSGWSWGNGTTASPNRYAREFDLEGKLVSYPLGHPGNNGVIRTLHYDAVGRITGITHTGNGQTVGALDQTYYYDDLDRLTGFDAIGTSQRYAYDKNGNRSQATFGSTTYTYTLSATSNRLGATTGPFPAKTNTYDAAGNLTGDGTVSYTYGVNGRMETSSAAGITTRYRYNARGERVVKTASAGSSYYVYDEQGHLLGEYDVTGTPLQETVYLGDLPVAVVMPGVSGPVVHYVYADHLQAPRVLTRASDNRIVWRWDYADPFGLVQPDENPSSLGKFTFNLRFPGQVFDKETNNH
jgi:YD repeat-containing protein